MKKLLKLLLLAVMVMMITACSGGGSASSGGKKKVADDQDVLALHFTTPGTFESVERYCEVTTEGKLVEKDIVFNFADGESVGFAVMPGEKLAEMTNVDNLEQYEINGFKVYRFDSGNDMMAFIQNGEDLYAVDRYLNTVDDGTILKEVLGGVSFTKSTTTTLDEAGFDELNYQLDDDHSVYKTATRISEDAEGNQTEKMVFWYYGSDENTDFRFMINAYRNSTFEDILSKEDTYEEKEINGIAYKVLVNTNGDPSYEYYTQHGNDVYMIRNSGTSNGWFVDRSEESYTCFEKFLNTVSFK